MSLSKDKKRSGHAEVIVGDAIEQRSPAPARLATTQATEKDRVLEQSLKSESTVASLHPEDWIKRIRKLKQEGKLEDFKRELAEFRKRNPDFTVPKDIDIR